MKTTVTLAALLHHNAKSGRISIINYNDSVDFSQVRKDNDTLAADMLRICDADRLIVLGRYDGFYDSENRLVEEVSRVTQWMYECCNGISLHGNGGFEAKLRAAEQALALGKEMMISNIGYCLDDVIEGTARRTRFAREI